MLLQFTVRVLAAAAVTLLISRATITGWIREAMPLKIRHGIECPMCVGFWISAALTAVCGEIPGTSLWLLAIATWGGVVVACGLADPY